MSMFADYWKELDNVETIETEYGFIQYQYLEDGKVCYLKDVYVAPAFRGSGEAAYMRNAHPLRTLTDMVANIAKEAGCKMLLSRVALDCAGAEKTLLCQLFYGMKLSRTGVNEIWLSKEIV